ncbi:hypothetical protein CSV61_16080 [Sporosarcina sp. P3]|uniref:hypothetical protein n=1 Tax=Sporosarcina sp. P3 TaxID=2048245 RepID=UPI000C167633|nr:hypothetical protein [Sporosarcina sp. P3]PID20166.1 hypothetical protein CSV61_16080 [Sporosarcina sp. P3]
MNQLRSADYAILQRYWVNYEKIVKELNSGKCRDVKRTQRMKEITAVIEYLFNSSSEDMQKVIQLSWWHRNQASEVSEDLFLPVSKVNRMQRAILDATANYLLWI